MTATREDVYKLIGHIQDDLRQTQAKLVKVRAMLAAGAMNSTSKDQLKCPHPLCGIQVASPGRLTEHLLNVHGEEAA